MKFEKLNYIHKEIFDRFFDINENVLCDYSFNVLFLWKDYYNISICLDNNTLFIKYYIHNTPIYFIPYGDTSYGINKLIKYTRSINESLRISNIHSNMLKYIPDTFRISHVRGNYDYVYSTNDLAILAGKEYKAKRNFVNSFKNKYNYSVEEIAGINEEIIDFINKYALDIEKDPMINGLNNFSLLNLKGIILKVENKIVGITYGSLYNDVFIVHFEKVNYEYTAASQMINYLLANYILGYTKYINREEDLGLFGLRKAKLSYNPIHLIECFSAIYKDDFNILICNPTNDDKDSIIKLWKECFNDGDYSKLYLDNYYDIKNTFVIKINGSIKAMCLVMIYDNIGYVYALCTHPDFRDLGFASQIINYVKTKYNNIILIPQDSTLIDYYKTLGFKEIVSKYEGKLKLDNYSNVVYSSDYNVNKLLDIYNTIENSLHRDFNTYDKIFKLDNYKVIYNDDSYAIYHIKNNKLIVDEVIGNIDIIHAVMKHEGFIEAIYYSNKGDKAIKLMSNMDIEYLYCNLLFE